VHCAQHMEIRKPGNLPTKFEVSNSTHYEDVKGGTKCRKWGGFG